ncbi:hypothetical protein [Lelliottia aquatilis]|uniref:hypothetical protein n=1 Tax=Lelliottia aquatilis TaxID=2080838 RepID=UPI0013FDBFF9
MKTSHDQVVSHVLCVMRIMNVSAACSDSIGDKLGAPTLALTAGMLTGIHNGFTGIPHIAISLSVQKSDKECFTPVIAEFM